MNALPPRVGANPCKRDKRLAQLDKPLRAHCPYVRECKQIMLGRVARTAGCDASLALKDSLRSVVVNKRNDVSASSPFVEYNAF